LKALGYTASEAQIHTISVFIVALVSLNLCSYFPEKVQHRYGSLVIGDVLGILGWSIELAQVKAVSARYFGMFVGLEFEHFEP
jgi:hypothetical protein